MEFSISSLSIQEPKLQHRRRAQATIQSSPGFAGPPAPAGAGRSSSLDALGPAWKEEEASFWKINAGGPWGRGRVPSLTPSQIKSMEKGEGPAGLLPAGARTEGQGGKGGEAQPPSARNSGAAPGVSGV